MTTARIRLHLPRAASATPATTAAFAFAAVLGLAACGGAAPEAKAPVPTAPATEPAPGPEPTTTAPTVRYDDLGVSFVMPKGYALLDDATLATRVRESASVKLRSALEANAAKNKSLPLLSLQKQDVPADEGLSVMLGVSVVPKDATADELAQAQRATLAEAFPSFAVTEGPTPREVDGVRGVELAGTYELPATTKRPSTRVAARMRIFVRDGLATVATASWAAKAPLREEEARLVLDGLHFHAPTP